MATFVAPIPRGEEIVAIHRASGASVSGGAFAPVLGGAVFENKPRKAVERGGIGT